MDLATLLVSLLACYGLVFLVQNKLWRPAKLPWLVEKLWTCSYCLGFWMGLLLGLARVAALGTPDSLPAAGLDVFTFAFASSVFSYSLDAAVQWLEETRDRK